VYYTHKNEIASSRRLNQVIHTFIRVLSRVKRTNLLCVGQQVNKSITQKVNNFYTPFWIFSNECCSVICYNGMGSPDGIFQPFPCVYFSGRTELHLRLSRIPRIIFMTEHPSHYVCVLYPQPTNTSHVLRASILDLQRKRFGCLSQRESCLPYREMLQINLQTL